MTGALLAILAMIQGPSWSVWPPHPTVGDTVWVEGVVATPPGWRVRPGRLPAGESYEPLSDPLVLRHDSGWLVRYAVVMWTPGTVGLPLPPSWRLGPGGEADSVEFAPLSVVIRSVIPDSVKLPEPKPPLAPLWPDVRRPLAPALALLVAVLALAGGVAWRRRSPRPIPDAHPAAAAALIGDDRWITAGEPRAVAARATAMLRRALVLREPEAHPALSTVEALAIAARALPDTQHHELAAVLTALDQVGFAAGHGAAVGDLARRAQALAGGLAS